MTSWPAILAMPLVAGIYVVRMRMVVVLPAPLGPRKPTISPRATSKLMFRTATTGPKSLDRFLTSIMGAQRLHQGEPPAGRAGGGVADKAGRGFMRETARRG